jgi:hypothetical protein
VKTRDGMDLDEYRCFDKECRAQNACQLWLTRNDPNVRFRVNTLRMNWECRDTLCQRAKELHGLPDID